MCHRTSGFSRNLDTDRYGDGDVPEIDVEPYRDGSQVVTPTDPLPETSRERRDGPGGE